MEVGDLLPLQQFGCTLCDIIPRDDGPCAVNNPVIVAITAQETVRARGEHGRENLACMVPGAGLRVHEDRSSLRVRLELGKWPVCEDQEILVRRDVVEAVAAGRASAR